MKIKQQLVTSREKTYTGLNSMRFITIHETGNKKKGANAQAHANLQTNGYKASWHWQVDEKEAIQSFPHSVRCWHAGDGKGQGNFESIGIELCINEDGNFNQTILNAVKLICNIMIKENIPIANVVQHYKFSGKDCPYNIRKGNPISWNGFISLIEKEMKNIGLKPEAEKEVENKTLEQRVTELESQLKEVGPNKFLRDNHPEYLNLISRQMGSPDFWRGVLVAIKFIENNKIISK